MAKRFWIKVEDNLMYDKFADTQTRELCKILDRSYSSVSNRANFLGLKKSEAFLKSDLSGRITKLSELGKIYRYKKGNIPANKGKKQSEYMSQEAIDRTKATRFKKGSIPANAYSNGEETTRKNKCGREYILIKVPGKRKLIFKHRHIWEQVHGKIPKGYIVIFKDGNTMNCVIENLECISREENMSRNTIHQYPDELKELIKINKKVKKRINEKQK